MRLHGTGRRDDVCAIGRRPIIILGPGAKHFHRQGLHKYVFDGGAVGGTSPSPSPGCRIEGAAMYHRFVGETLPVPPVDPRGPPVLCHYSCSHAWLSMRHNLTGPFVST